MRYLLSVLSLFVSLCFINQSHAYVCVMLLNSVDIDIPQILPVSPSMQNGDFIGTYSGRQIDFAKCTDTSGITEQYIVLTTASNVYGKSNDGYIIMKSNIDGVGYAFGGTSSACDGEQWVNGPTYMKTICINETGPLRNADHMTFQPKIRLYKIGDVGTSATEPLLVGLATLITNRVRSGYSPTIKIPKLTFNHYTCSINSNKNINVDMGKVNSLLFTSIGSTAGRVSDFNIKVQCNLNSPIFLTINGDSSNNAKGLLNLSNVTGSAAGVAVQILYNSLPFALNTKKSVGTLTQNVERSVDLQARFYKTAENITAGIVKASATFTLQYN